MKKNVVITGASRGIGFATLLRFVKSGHNVWACAHHRNIEFEEKISALAKEHQVWIKPVYFDLSDEESLKDGIKRIIDEKLPIDVLVNNAGIPFGGLMTMTPISKLKEVFQVNYFSQVQIMQQVARRMMRQKSGCIVNVASVAGIETYSGYLAYGASKSAVVWTTKAVSKELGSYGIRVNAVAPGLTDTQMTDYKSDEESQKVVQRTALKRMGNPSEIANAIVFLASEEASFITGHVLVVDGGRLA